MRSRSFARTLWVAVMVGSLWARGASAAPTYALAFSSYLGGDSKEDTFRDTAIDSAGNVYVVGGTETALSQCTAHSGNMDALVLKTDSSGTLAWCTLLGGSGYDRVYDIEVAPDGNLIIGGRGGAGFPVTAGALDTSFAAGGSGLYGTQDGFVCKINSSTGSVMWCSYFGTSDGVIVRGIDVDDKGDVYVASSACKDLPYSMVNARNTGGNGCDSVVAKISADGSKLIWGRYIGGSGNEGGCNSVSVDDATHEVYSLNCQTTSTDMPVPNGWDTTLGGIRDAHLSKVSADGTQILFGSYVGGSRSDANGLHGVISAGNGVVFLETDTDSDDIPTTTGVYQQSNPGNPTIGDFGGTCVIWKVDTTKTGAASLLAATYFGGSDQDGCEGLTLTAQGNVALPVTTSSPNLSVVGGLPCTGCAKGSGYVAVLSADLTTLIFGSYLGGSDQDEIRAVVHGNKSVAVVGNSWSRDFPTLSPWQAKHAGGPLYNGNAPGDYPGRDGTVTIFSYADLVDVDAAVVPPDSSVADNGVDARSDSAGLQDGQRDAVNGDSSSDDLDDGCGCTVRATPCSASCLLVVLMFVACRIRHRRRRC